MLHSHHFYAFKWILLARQFRILLQSDLDIKPETSFSNEFNKKMFNQTLKYGSSTDKKINY